MPTTESKVDTPTAAYRRMEAERRPVAALYTGTEGMRNAGETWLPREVAEEWQHYQRRLARSFLIPLYADGVDKIVAKPFSKPVQVNGELPEQLAGLQDDVDGRGTDLTSFAKALFRDGVDWGELHGVVDAMSVPEGLNRGEEREYGVRPYFCRLEPPSVICARETYARGSLPYLSQLRAKECYMQPDGAFGEKDVKAVRVWSRDGQGGSTVTVWTASGSANEYVPGESVRVTYPGGIPHSYAAFTPVAAYESKPSMAALSQINMMHWQAYSDHRNWMKLARSMKLWGHGIPATDAKAGLVIADTAASLYTTDKAELFLLEPTGSAMTLSFKDIEDIEQKAQLVAMMPYVQQAVAQTATAKSYDEERGISVVQAWVRLTERAVEKLYQIAAKWYGLALPEDFSVDIFSDFGLSLRAMQDSQTLIAMRAANQITQDTFLREMKGRGVLGDMVEVEKEIDATRGERERIELRSAGLGEMLATDEQIAAKGPKLLPPLGVEEQAGAAQGGGKVQPRGLLGASTLQDTALNGAQVQSALSIVQEVAAGKLPRDSGVAMLIGFFNLGPEEAEAIMGSVGRGFVPTPDPTEPPPAEPPPPAGDDEQERKAA